MVGQFQPWGGTVPNRSARQPPPGAGMRDPRDTIRLLGRRPGFVAAVALTLGAAIALNTAVFSVLNGLVLRPASGAAAVLVALVSDRFWRTGLDAFPEALARRAILNGAGPSSFGIPASDTLSLGGFALLAMAAMMVACYASERRAARRPALLSLRSE